MAIDESGTTYRSRRAVITAGLASAAALVAAAFGRPVPVRAGVDGDVVLGATNYETATTTISKTNAGGVALQSTATDGGTGVQGLSYGPSAGVGVVGQSNGGGTGVYGYSPSGGQGIWGEGAAAGIGVYATAPVAGIALKASGKVSFSRSGKSLITAGHSTKTVSLSGVTSSSLVFAVLRSNRSGRWVRAVVPGSGSFKVYLNTSVGTNSYISWFVLD
jgi:hypothetical protein